MQALARVAGTGEVAVNTTGPTSSYGFALPADPTTYTLPQQVTFEVLGGYLRMVPAPGVTASSTAYLLSGAGGNNINYQVSSVEITATIPAGLAAGSTVLTITGDDRFADLGRLYSGTAWQRI